MGHALGFSHNWKASLAASWEDVRDNFGKAAQFGIDTKFNWFDEKKYVGDIKDGAGNGKGVITWVKGVRVP